MAARYDLKLSRGETFERVLKYLDANRVPVNLTGATVTLHVTVNGITTVYTVASGHLVVMPLSGQITITFTDAQVGTLAFKVADHYLKIVFASGVAKKLIRGNATVDD